MLMAAAPELLEALAACHSAMVVKTEEEDWAFKNAQDVIAKALGEADAH